MNPDIAFTALVPARLASSRLPRKPLADLAGLPMVVRAARQAQASGARRVVVAADDDTICEACRTHGVEALLTRADHPSGSDRLAEAATVLGLADDEIVVNVQGDEPLIDPALVRAVALRLHDDPACPMATAAHALRAVDDLRNPNVVKVVLDAAQRALLFTRAPVPWWRDGSAPGELALPSPPPLRHIGLYAYRAGFLRAFPELPPSPLEVIESLEQLRVLWHGHRITVHLAAEAPAAGVDTPEDLARVRAVLAGRP